MKIVVGDIGGTNARFAIAELGEGAPPRIGAISLYRAKDHDGLASAWAAYRAEAGGALPEAASLALAAPIDGDELVFTNSGWRIDRRTIAGALGLARLHLLNDYGAVAHAVSVLPAEGLVSLCGPDMPIPSEGIVTVLGPGTGLGVAILARRAGRVEVIETEAAHIGFAPQTEFEEGLARAIQARLGRCSVERIVSGPGLVEILACSLGKGPDEFVSAEVWDAALTGSDPLAAWALDVLIGALGTAAGDFSLAHGSTGVVLTGGLANRMRARLATGLFHTRFTDKGRYAARMARIPIRLATEPEPGLLGAAMAFERSNTPSPRT